MVRNFQAYAPKHLANVPSFTIPDPIREPKRKPRLTCLQEAPFRGEPFAFVAGVALAAA
jgi:hypothetical protein